ncbi:Phosphatidylinositol 4-phosphate 5-kinase 2 [Spatholobus suberectus]|nr:Phosphatidylinositol 4-phosphate 5-kinase 2 [Spatholobus suberectus]
MEHQKSGSKLTRTHSSLLSCSSPALRSSVHNLSSIVGKDEQEQEQEHELLLDVDDDKNKKNKKPQAQLQARAQAQRSSSYPTLAVFCLGAGSLFFYFFYLEVSSSENVLLALIFVAVALYLVSRNKALIHHSYSLLKHSWEENVRRLGFSKTAAAARPVQWFIGESAAEAAARKAKIVREGVEFYSNGDFYEGEFHKGRSNGSGVYHYFVNGRYEGDWVDGRYDGHGIESWARGSRYRGQYRQGLRHGFGVYRFYTGDSYSGEWSNGQSHGLGLQTCSDASCYIGQFKYGVKHGLGVTILEMEIDMLGSILETRYMDLGSTTLPTATVMREHGTRVVGKVWAHTLFETVTGDVVNGMLATSSNLYHHYLILFFEQFRYLLWTFICYLSISRLPSCYNPFRNVLFSFFSHIS